MNLFTIGFTKKSAEDFFARLASGGVKRLIDVRVNTTSQLAGFAKAQDLKFFLRSISQIEYLPLLELAPTQDVLKAYRTKDGISWDEYEERFLELIRKREVESLLDRETLSDSCLLCSEDKPHHCHRRLVAEYLQDNWDVPIQIIHL